MIKQKFIALALVCGLVASALIGCGNSKKKQAMEELGISSEEYDEIAEAFDDSSNDSDSENTEVEEEPAEPILFDMKDELNSYDYSTYTYQVDDDIINIAPGTTVSDLQEILKDYIITNEDGSEDINYDQLLAPDGKVWLYVKSQKQPDGVDGSTSALQILLKNLSDETISLSDCLVSGVIPNTYYVGSLYMAPGFPVSSTAIEADENMKFANIYDYFKSIGMLEYTEEAKRYPNDRAGWDAVSNSVRIDPADNGLACSMDYYYSPVVIGDKTYYYELSFMLVINKDTSLLDMSGVQFTSSYKSFDNE